MAKLIDSLANRIIDLEYQSDPYDDILERFEQISDSDTYGIIEREKNVNTKKPQKVTCACSQIGYVQITK